MNFWKDKKQFLEEVQLTAVRQNGEAIKYITDPSEGVQLVAVRQNGYAIYHITDPSNKVIHQAMLFKKQAACHQ